MILQKQGLDKKIIKFLGLKKKRNKSLVLTSWRKFVSCKAKKKVKIGIVGKYQKTGDYLLSDSYVCVIEAIKHSACFLKLKPEIHWFDSSEFDNLTQEDIGKRLLGINGIIVPQGWGSRGVEGKINAVQFARENQIPYLGLCFGMQVATIEFARNVLGLKNANSQEVNPETSCSVIHIIPNQKKYLKEKNYGGTIRLGAWPCVIKKGSLLEEAYLNYGKDKKSPWFIPRDEDKVFSDGELVVFERHRHRYEFNLDFKRDFEKKGFVISGLSHDEKLVEAIEIKNHPFFVGTQFHPEYLSRPLSPHPVFISFLYHLST